jgi:hypothetical protein
MSETPAMLPSSIVITLFVSFAASATSDMLRTVKSSGAPGPILCRWRSSSAICVCAV